MRPLIDVNNLSYSKEKLIYYSQTTIYAWLLAAIGLFIFAIYSLTNKNTFIVFAYYSIFSLQSIKVAKES